MNSGLLERLALSRDDEPPQLRTPQRAQAHESAILKLKGLPYDTSKAAVLEFFQGFDVKNIEFVFEPDGRPSGLAFAEFLSRDEALRAMAKNGEFIGERYVKLLLVPRQEMEEQVRMGTIAIPGGAARARAGLLKRRGMRLPLPSGMPGMPGMPSSVDMLMNMMPNGAGMLPPHPYSQPHAAYSSPSVRDMFSPDSYLYLQPHLPHLPAHMPKSLHQGLQLQAQMMPQGQLTMQAMHLQQQMRMPLPPQMGPHMGLHGPPQMTSQLGPTAQHYMHHQQPSAGHPNGLHSPHGHNHHLHPPPSQPDAPPPGPSPPANLPPYTAAGGGSVPSPSSTQEVKTLKVRGLPFRITPAELMHFFSGYHYLPDSCAFGKDALGRPSGEAWLTFASHEEAVRAVAERNRRYLRNRYLELSLWHG